MQVPSLFHNVAVDNWSRSMLFVITQCNVMFIRYSCKQVDIFQVIKFCHISPWASHQIRKIAGCACVGNVGNVFPATDFKGNRWLATPESITFAIANPRWWGKRSRHSRCMLDPQFYVSGNRPLPLSINLQRYVKYTPYLTTSSRPF